MDDKLKIISSIFGQNQIKLNESLFSHTAHQSGGEAKLFFIAYRISDLMKIVQSCRELKIPFFVFGTGTKMDFSDQGFDGVVIQNRTQNMQVVGVKGKASRVGIGVDEALIEADSGVSMQKLVEFLDQQGLVGLEIKGLAGSLGGNIFFSFALQRKVVSVKVLNEFNHVEEIKPQPLNIKKHIVLSATLKFKAK